VTFSLGLEATQDFGGVPLRGLRLSRVLGIGLLCTHCLLAANGTGSLTGSVLDDSGHPISAARVLVNHAPSVKPPFPAPPVITGPLAATAVPDFTGSFHVDNLPPGDYIVCVETTVSGYLDPCHWSTSAPNFTISAGQTTSGVKIVMAKGPVLWIQVNDPQQFLKPVTGPVDLGFEIHVVTSKGVHYSAPIQSSTATGRSHAITIPFDTPVSLRVLSTHFTVNDQSGNVFAVQGATVNAPAGTTPAVIGLTVAGKK
jgi:Carboxypeptidase regulatory-like domain